MAGLIFYLAITRVRLLAVTDDAIYVLQCSNWFGQFRAKRVLAVLPRTTRLGPPGGLQTKVKLGTMTLYLAGSDQILAADAWRPSPEGTGGAQPSQLIATPSFPGQPGLSPADAASAPGGQPMTLGGQPDWSAPAGQGAQPSYPGLAVPYSAAPMFAGFLIRLVAYVIDAVIIVALSVTIIGLVVAIPYMPVMWWKKGATLGQRVLGLKVVRAADGGPIDGSSAFVRFIVFILESIGSSVLIGLLGFIWAAFEPRKRAWHDMAAGTVVIHAR